MEFELSLGRLHLHACFDEDESESVELHSETKIVGFQPNRDWEEDDDED